MTTTRSKDQIPNIVPITRVESQVEALIINKKRSEAIVQSERIAAYLEGQGGAAPRIKEALRTQKIGYRLVTMQ